MCTPNVSQENFVPSCNLLSGLLCRSQAQLLYSGALLWRGPAMPSRHGTNSYANQRHDISYQKRSQVAAGEGAARIARVSFPDGLASETQHRPTSCVASRGPAINGRGTIAECDTQKAGRPQSF